MCPFVFPGNKSTSSSNPPPIKKALTPSAGVTKPTPTRPSQGSRPKSSTPAKKDTPTAASNDKPKAQTSAPKTPTSAPKTPTAAPKAPAPAAAPTPDKAKEAKQNGSK